MTCQLLRIPAGQTLNAPPALTVVIHTEEEFDWSQPFDRTSTGTNHVRYLDRVQSIFDSHGLCPNYLIDFPIASSRDAIDILGTYRAEGRAAIGTHLHPWVSPPHDEDVSTFNSYPGNLPADLEHQKLETLSHRIAENFGERPTVYLAGRYGFGPATARTLHSLGYEVDVSMVPTFDYRGDGGPDFHAERNHPFWDGPDLGLLRVPHTSAWVGKLARNGHPLSYLLASRQARKLKLAGALARSGMLRHTRLSPEGNSLSHMIALTRSLFAHGVRCFLFSFHSPSVEVGYTPYVKSVTDLDRFLASIDSYLEFFKSELNGEFTTLTNYRKTLIAQCASQPDP